MSKKLCFNTRFQLEEKCLKKGFISPLYRITIHLGMIFPNYACLSIMNTLHGLCGHSFLNGLKLIILITVRENPVNFTH